MGCQKNEGKKLEKFPPSHPELSLSHFAFGHEAQEKEATIQLNIPHSEAVPLLHSEQISE